jgi:hypothetical protein
MYVEDGDAKWPLGQRWWVGAETRCLGAATRVKQILFVKAKVYSVALYVEGKPAARELGLRSRGGFLAEDADFASALTDGAFVKVLAMRLLRDVTGEQFAEAISAQLAPRARLTGAGAALEQYVSFISKQSLSAGTRLAHLWTADGEQLQVRVEKGDDVDWESKAPELTVASASLARGMFEIYLGGSPIVPEARTEWAKGARLLLESDNVKRATDKEGGSAFW